MSPTKSLAVAVAAAAIVVVAAVLVSFPREENRPTVAQQGDRGSITIITISAGSLLSGASYSVTPGPSGSGTFTVQDGSEDDANPAAGMIEVGQVAAGNYTVAQREAPPGYSRDRLSKVVEVNGNSATATFSNPAAGTAAASPQPKSVIYTAKFECGTISGSEGPLRPGHYDTDIGVLNKQDFEIRMTWSAVQNDGKSTNAILRTLEPQAATGIVCKDIRKLVGGEKFAEGFVIITVPLDSGLQSALAGGSTVVGRQSTDMLDVQVFYTANALPELPHEVLVDKIVFTVTDDPSGKVPEEMIGRTLDVTVPSGYEISDPVEKVREALAEQYGLSDEQAAGLQIRVDSISVGAGTMIDDHALSLSRVPPQLAS